MPKKKKGAGKGKKKGKGKAKAKPAGPPNYYGKTPGGVPLRVATLEGRAYDVAELRYAPGRKEEHERKKERKKRRKRKQHGA